MKRSQDFLVDAALGEKSFELNTPKSSPDQIVLSIEEGAVPVALLKETAQKAKERKQKSLFAQANNWLQSLGKPKPKDLATFFRLMAIMINAGIPLIKSLDTIAEQTMNYKLRMTISDIARAIEKGGTLSESMSHFPDVFVESHLGMVRSGEATGHLNSILKELAHEVEKSASMMRKVKGALMYPAFITVIMILVVAAMMILVVPKIAEIFTESGKQLPLLTRIVIAASNFMQQKWGLILGLIIGIPAAVMGARRTREGRMATDWVFINVPIFGELVKKSILARFSRLLANLLSSGVPIIEGLLINARGLGNEVYKRRVILASEDLARGIPLGESLRDSPEFPTMMVQMVAVGEETAQLDAIASKIAEYYEDEVDTTVNSISKVIEPVMMVVVGLVVGAIIGAVMLPIVQLTQISGSL